MALNLGNIEKANEMLREYKGSNPFILKLKNNILVYKNKTINEFEYKYLVSNYDTEPFEVNKIVKVADWWGEKKQIEWGTEFIPQKVKITWFIGQTDDLYHFYCIYRRSQEKAVEVFCQKKAILTDFLSEPWQEKFVDFVKYAEIGGRSLFPHQEDAVKFLTTRKKAILADGMGLGKTTAAIVSGPFCNQIILPFNLSPA